MTPALWFQTELFPNTFTQMPEADEIATAERPQVTSFDAGRIPSLDGLRGISILMVLASHCKYPYTDQLPPLLDKVLTRCAIGVDVFFIISGFLITLLLLREQDSTGRINLKSFYLRRAFRILPAYYCFVAVALCFPLLGWVDAYVPLPAYVAVPTFFVDFLVSCPLFVHHLWSLSVEEHFYLVFPLLVWWDRRWAVRLTVSWVILTPGFRYAVTHAPIVLPDIKFWTLTRADAISIGCLLAFALRSEVWRPRLAWSETISIAAATAAACLLVATTFAPPGHWMNLYRTLVSETVDAICIAVIIWTVVSRPKSLAKRLLESRPLVAVGMLSYSLYLWHTPFLVEDNIKPLAFRLLLVFAVAFASFRFVERPFLQIKKRYLTATSNGQPAGLQIVGPSMADATP